MEDARKLTYEFTLRDGTPVLLRPVQRDDKDLFLEGFKHLSLESRYLRFMRPVRQLTTGDLKFFTEIDYDNHMAWGALVNTPSEVRGIGVARYVREPTDPRRAETAIVIIDEYQHRGVGSRLIGALYWSALINEIDIFEGYILEENKRMRRLLKILNAEIESEGHGVLKARVAVVRDYLSLPDTPRLNMVKQVVTELMKHT
jgi:hypothetical protein